jgi:hypothetical protein
MVENSTTLPRSVLYRNKIVDIPTIILYRLVMAGLKSFLPWLSDATEITSDSLYERQRVLMRSGVLPVREGRGPGSGVPLNADTLAVLVIALLSTDQLADIALRTQQLCQARPFALNPKSRKNAPTFQADVAKALLGTTDSDGLQTYCGGIQVTRHWRGVILQNAAVPSQGDHFSGVTGVIYTVSEQARLSSSLISTTSSIEQEGFWFLCSQFRETMKTED